MTKIRVRVVVKRAKQIRPRITRLKDAIKSDDTNICDKLGMFTIIYNRYSSIKRKISSSSSQGQGKLDYILGKIYLTSTGDAVTLNIYDRYNSEGNSKGCCRSNCRNNHYTKSGQPHRYSSITGYTQSDSNVHGKCDL